jgi:hypothetical protein
VTDTFFSIDTMVAAMTPEDEGSEIKIKIEEEAPPAPTSPIDVKQPSMSSENSEKPGAVSPEGHGVKFLPLVRLRKMLIPLRALKQQILTRSQYRKRKSVLRSTVNT